MKDDLQVLQPHGGSEHQAIRLEACMVQKKSIRKILGICNEDTVSVDPIIRFQEMWQLIGLQSNVEFKIQIWLRGCQKKKQIIFFESPL